MRGTRNIPKTLVVMTLTVAVVFASLCFPVTCTAEVMAAGACPDCGTSAGPNGAMPVSHDSGGAATTCTHVIRSTVQAVETNILALHLDTAVLGLFVQVAAVLMLGAFVFAQPRPSEPPGLVAVAANLRI